MRIDRLFAIATIAAASCIAADAQTGRELPFQTWALTPPMGWNSWDCYGPTVVESEVKANADYMAEHLAPYGWEYVVVDIRWFVENDKAGGYNQTNPIYVIDSYGRYTPALNRFPSAANGEGFRPLADYVHSKGLKFGIHLMRGVPKKAVSMKLPVLGTDGITCDMIANNDSTCTWLRDNMKVDWTRPGAQEYYNSCFDMYASWGVDFVKIDDLSRPYHTAEIEMIRNAIDRCGRPMVLSLSPGETPVEKAGHAATHANMWRTVDDFWDNWSQLNYQFGVCAKWAPYIAPGTWPDADMLPLGKISIRGERGAERWTNFTPDEQQTMMTLWTIFKSPLMFGGDLPQNDDATNRLLTNERVIYMHHYSANNRQVRRTDSSHITWAADDPANGDKFVALFNLGGTDFVNTRDALWRSGTISYLTTGYATDVDVPIPAGSRELALIATDGGDGFDSDHSDWLNPTLVMADGSTVDLTTLKAVRSTCGWGSVHVNSNIEGGTLSVDGTKYDRGFATHANSILLFDLPEGVVRFTAKAGIDNTGTDQGSKSSVEFMVFNYDPTMREETTDTWTGGNITIHVDPTRQAACSGFIGKNGRRKAEISAPVASASKLYLVVTDGGDGLSYDHADWGNPVLVRADGTEMSLTEIAWDANPINGWNAPKLNKNNDGNTMSIDGTTYAKGFGVNAPSILTFTLPEGHNFTTFKATVGYDDDVNNAPQGVSMEFRVFTVDPAPDLTADVPLDLTLLGFEPDARCTITDMWSGENLGTFSGSEFAPTLKPHASGLYRVSAVNRTEGATIKVVVSTGNSAGSRSTTVKSDDTVKFSFTVEGGDTEGAYIQLRDNGKVIGTLTFGNDPDAGNDSQIELASGESRGAASGNAAVYVGKFTPGTHTFEAFYSGTTTVKSTSTGEFMTLEVEPAGVPSISREDKGITVRPLDGAVEITADRNCTLPVYTLSGALFTTLRLTRGTTRHHLPSATYLLNSRLHHIR